MCQWPQHLPEVVAVLLRVILELVSVKGLILCVHFLSLVYFPPLFTLSQKLASCVKVPDLFMRTDVQHHPLTAPHSLSLSLFIFFQSPLIWSHFF